jgi:hypothetical protein
MRQDDRPFGIAEIGGLGTMGIGDLGGLLDVGDQVVPGGSETLVGLGLGTAFHQGLDHASGGDLLATAIEDLLLKLGDESISLVAELDCELRHESRKF